MDPAGTLGGSPRGVSEGSPGDPWRSPIGIPLGSPLGSPERSPGESTRGVPRQTRASPRGISSGISQGMSSTCGAQWVSPPSPCLFGVCPARDSQFHHPHHLTAGACTLPQARRGIPVETLSSTSPLAVRAPGLVVASRGVWLVYGRSAAVRCVLGVRIP